MKTTENQLLIFERHFSPEKRCRPPLGWGIMPSACFSAPPPGGLVEGAGAGQHIAAGAAWVDLPEANPSGRAERERASQYPQRSRPSEQRHNDERRESRRSLQSSPKDETIGSWRGKNRQMAPALRVTAILAEGPKAFGFEAWYGALLRRLRVYSPQRGCSRNTCRGTAWVDLPVGQTRQGEPRGSEQVKAALSANPSYHNGLYAIKSVLPLVKKFQLLSLARLFLFIGIALVVHPPLDAAPLSPLASQPDWPSLRRYAGTITAGEFEELLQRVYVPDGSWRKWITLTPTQALITPSAGAAPISLELASPGNIPKRPERYWKSRDEHSFAQDRPLAGVRIAIDPGHLGGNFAKMEARWFRIGNSRPVEEGEMTLIVAKLLKQRLEALGAQVWLTRSRNGATTSLRPGKLTELANSSLQQDGLPVTPIGLQHEAELLFYRVAEIRNRARLVNQVIRPDLVICLHFNAEEWGDPAHPSLTDKNHLHLILCGALSEEELQHEDERFTMLVKLLSGTHGEELAASESVSRALASATGLPPFVYHNGKAFPASSNPYLWIRNLLANRLFECPVVYCEPYVMNSRQVFQRVQMGDYSGTRSVDGIRMPSIFREYADAVAQGLADYYNGKAH